MKTEFLIGELARQFQISRQTIRYYERLGLIGEPVRNGSGYRLYSIETCERLKLIISAQKFGLSLQEIKQLLACDPNTESCQSIFVEMVQSNLKAVEKQLQVLTAKQDILKRQWEQLQLLHHGESLNLRVINAQSLQKVMDRVTANLQTPTGPNDQDRSQDLLNQYSAGDRNFQGMKLMGAQLNGAILSGADFSEAELMLASLNEVSMEKTILRRAFLSGADLVGAYLKGAELYGATLIGSDFSEANLSGASLVSCNLGGAKLCDADLRGANFSEANLIGADLRGADLTGAIFLGCNLLDANLQGIKGEWPEINAGSAGTAYG